MNELIKYFNNKYSKTHGKIAYPRTTLQIYQVYQIIKSSGIEDEKLNKLLDETILPKPKTTEEKEAYAECIYESVNIPASRKYVDGSFPKKTSIEDKKIYLLKENGEKIDQGTELPSLQEQAGQGNTIQIFTDLATTEVTFDSDKTILESLDTLIDTVEIEVNQVFRGQSYASDNPISGNCEIQIEILKTKMNNGARDVVCQVTLTSTTDSPYKWMMLTRRTAGMTSSQISMPLTPMITDVNKKYVDNSLKNKVDKVTGKGLSTVDFTKSYETKLKGLENYNDAKVKEDIETISTQLGDIAKQLEGGNIGTTVEPQLMDIPRIYFSEGTLPTTKTATTLKFDYYSKTAEYHGWAEIKCQGTSSMQYPKKNFTIKLYKDKAKTTKLKIDFKEWGKQSKFVLKANWIDITHARNIVSARVWGDIVKSRSGYTNLPELLRTSPNQGAIDGFPIVVYGNGYYQGRYTLNIPKDKWMSNMDDTLDTHCILCGENYYSGCFLQSANINGSDWTDELHDVVPASIKTRWNEVITFVKDSTDVDFKANLNNYIDVESAIDYLLYGLISTGLDGFGKNQIYLTYDGVKWIASMYDMDTTWGLWWNGSKFVSDAYSREEFQDMVVTSSCTGEGNKLYVRLQKLFINEIKARYAELRKSIFTYPYLVNKFEEFCQICPQDIVKEDYASTTATGAYTGIPSKTTNNIQQIRKNINARLQYVDSYIHGYVTALNLDKDNITLNILKTDTSNINLLEGIGSNIQTNNDLVFESITLNKGCYILKNINNGTNTWLKVFVNDSRSIQKDSTEDRIFYVLEDDSTIKAQCHLIEGNTKDNIGLHKLQNIELVNSTPITKVGDGYLLPGSTNVYESTKEEYSIIDLDVSKKYCVRTKSSDLGASSLCCLISINDNSINNSVQCNVNYNLSEFLVENSDKLYICVPKTLGIENVNLVEITTSNSMTTIYGTDVLTATLTPVTATNKNVNWSVDNSNVELVPDGLNCTVKAKANGNSVVTCTSQDTTNGTISDTCNVTVTDVLPTPTDDAVYTLPQAKTFNGTSDYIDTGVKLFDTVKDFTIFINYNGEATTQQVHSVTLMHCIHEESPYYGVNIARLSSNNELVVGGKGDSYSKDLGASNKLILQFKGGVITSIKDSEGNEYRTSSNMTYQKIDETVILGAYQRTDGTKGRFWKGTINQFKVWFRTLTDNEINALLS